MYVAMINHNPRCDLRRHPRFHAPPAKRRIENPSCSHLLLFTTLTRKQRKAVTIATTNTMRLQRNRVTQLGKAISGKNKRRSTRSGHERYTANNTQTIWQLSKEKMAASRPHHQHISIYDRKPRKTLRWQSS